MNIIVLLKQTFHTEEQIHIQDGKIVEDGAEFVINPYDEYAVEEAVKIKEEHGGEVTVITFGPLRAESALRTALAMGADKAVLIDNGTLEEDEYTASCVLAAAVKAMPYDLILCGNMTIDGGSAQVGPRIAELLGIPHIATITKLELNGRQVHVERDVEGDSEMIEAGMPVLLTTQQGLNEPRYPSMPNILRAKKKPLDVINGSDLHVDQDLIKAKTELADIYLPPKKTAGKILRGSLNEQVKDLVHALCHEAKVV